MAPLLKQALFRISSPCSVTLRRSRVFYTFIRLSSAYCVGPDEKQSASTRLPQLSSRIAPSAGKSYLDKPSTSPDPFGARVEMDAPPSVNQAVAASSSIMNTLR